MKRVVLGLAVGAGLLGVAGVEGCNRVTHAAADGPAPRGQTTSESTLASIDDPNYHAELVLAGACQHQTPCQLQAVVVAKGDYHINDKYPYRFTPQDPPDQGLSYPKRDVGRAEGEFEHKRAVLSIPFLADGAGEKKVGGTLSFSVCSAANCLMDKQSLGLLVRVD